MTNIVFIHGTGVREESYLHSLERIQRQLADRQNLSIYPCYWGALGAELHRGGVSIPNYEKPPDEEREQEVALWGLLYEDPLYELRLLTLRRGGRRGGMGISPGLELAQTAKELEPDGELMEKLRRAGLEKTFLEARSEITGSRVFREALKHAPAALAEYRAAIARAFLAEAMARGTPDEEQGERRIEAGLREEIADLLIDALGGGERALGWLKEKAGELLARAGTRYASRHRSSLTDAGTLAGGDVLLYQARGEMIRGLIRKQLEVVESPVVLLAHSLGGIACVELLVAEALRVELLVTVGSQVPFLYEIGALRSLEVGDELPAHFPPWLNIYDLRDFLSYIGAGVFPGRVKDVEVDNRQPFPAAHSSYWENPEVWAAIDGALKK